MEFYFAASKQVKQRLASTICWAIFFGGGSNICTVIKIHCFYTLGLQTTYFCAEHSFTASIETRLKSQRTKGNGQENKIQECMEELVLVSGKCDTPGACSPQRSSF